MKSQKSLFLALLCCVSSNISTVYGYELATHGAMTYHAYQRSVLKDNQFLKALGIDTQINLNPAEPFGIAYYDISGNTANERQRHSFEGDIIQELATKQGLDVKPLALQGWLMRGAIREDDAYGEDNPQDDRDPANATLRRPLHHFFDPVNNHPLTVPGIGLLDADIHTAPAWGLGTTNANAFAQPPVAEVGRRNHFTVFDAREAMYRALTGRNKDNQEIAKTQAERRIIC